MTFPGYPAPTSNYTYMPNQFFDVVLPHFSRGAVRLCAYIARENLGWVDRFGKPQEVAVYISRSVLAREVNISNGAMSSSIKELIDGRVIVCVQPSCCETGEGGFYMLRWDKTKLYTRNPEKFQGFCARGGNMTHIPNLYLDYTVREEPLSVVQVVGAVFRNTVGYKDEDGWRRRTVALSQKDIMHQMNIVSVATVNAALKKAILGGHLVESSPGIFDTDAGRKSTAAVYAIHWSDGWTGERPPTKSVVAPSTKNVAVTHYKKRSDIETKEETKLIKQQQQLSTTSDVGVSKGGTPDDSIAAALRAVGFERRVAAEIMAAYPAEIIRSQLEYFPHRAKAENPQGMLRRAIENNWTPPASYQNKIEEQKKQDQADEARRRDRHMETYKPKYHEFVDKLLSEIKESDPEAWHLFEESETELVSRLRDENSMYKAHPDTFDKFLSHHNGRDAVRERAIKFFSDRVPSFWDWDRDTNPEGHEKRKIP